MAPPNERAANIDEVCQRLRLWAARDGRGLARVEYSSDFSRQKVLSQLAPALAEKGIALTTIELPQGKTAPEVVQFLLSELAEATNGVVSVSGFASAFQSHESLEVSLRVLNYNREVLTAFPLRQIWWMTPVLLQTSLHAMPDMHGWFSPHLTLSEDVLNSQQGLPPSTVETQSRLNSNIDDARQRSYRLLEQFEKARGVGATDIELLTTYLLPALKNLAEVGAQKEVRELMAQHKSVLNALQLVDVSKEYTQPLKIAANLNILAYLYYLQSRYAKAESTFQQALGIYQAELGSRHPHTITSLNNLAGLYQSQGRYAEAESLFQQALEIYQTELGDRHLDTATSLNNLAGLYQSRGRYAESESLFQQALEIYQTELGDRHLDTAVTLNNLAGLYRVQGRYSEAEPLYIEALDTRREKLGDRHPDTATSLFNLAVLYHQTQRPQLALSHIQQAITIYTETLGTEHPNTKAACSWLQPIQQAVSEESEP